MAQGNFTIKCDPSDLRRLMAKLERLERIESSRIVRNAMTEGGDLIKAKAKAAIVREDFIDTGGFKDSPSRHYRKKKKNNSSVSVGFKRGNGFHGNVAHLTDLGTKDRYTKKGQYRGRMKYNGFWTDIKDEDAPEVMEDIMDAIDREVDRIMKKTV